MRFTRFFSQQARKPSGWFGRWVMSRIFDLGNARLNRCVYDILSPQGSDHILDIGCGTGKLIQKIAGKTDGGVVEGIDFSQTMVSIAQRNNRRHIAAGRVVIHKGDFSDIPFEPGRFAKVCSVNTIYFWQDPVSTAAKIASILKPGGMLVVGYEDIAQLKNRRLDADVFRLYSTSEVETLLRDTGFALGVTTRSIGTDTAVYNCTVATR